MKSRTKLIWLAVVIVLSGWALAPRAGAAAKQMPITFGGYTGRSEVLTNFPVLVVLSNGVGSGFTFADFATTNGYDLRFATNSTSTNWLDYEVESWNTNAGQASYVWVRVPTIPGDGSGSIYAKWGDSANSNQLACTTNGMTWDANYRGVWHLASPAITNDSTANRYHGTNSSATATNGPVGGAAYFNGSSRITVGNIGSTPSSYMLECWGRRDTQVQSYGVFLTPSPDYQAEMAVTESAGNIYFGDLNLTYGTWTGVWTDKTAFHHIAVNVSNVALSGTSTLYFDGTDKGSISGNSTLGNWSNCRIGGAWGVGTYNGYDFKGQMDEVRISSTTRSTNWIWASYQTIASNAVFNRYGTVEAVGVGGGVLPAIVNAAVTGVTSGGATFNGTLTSTGSPACAVGVLWGTDTNSWATLNWFNGGAVNSLWTNSTPFSTNVTLSPNLNYYYTYVASNASGVATAASPVALITGNVTVEATDNSATYLSDNGTFTISRPPDLTNAALVVNYTTNGSTAVAGTDYTALSGSVTLNPGVSNATVTVTPLRYPVTPCTVILTLAAGGYATGTFNTATVTVQPKPPTDYTSTQSGNWHDPATWGSGSYPNGLGDNVTLSAGHTVTVAQVTTAYTVSNLTVNGNLTHLANTGAVEQYKINLTVLGDLNVAGAIDANGKGWATTANPGPGAGSGNLYTGSHGGEGYNVHGPTYGSITNPVTLGSAGYWNGDTVHPGGGAVLLRVSGASAISGTISANGKTTGAVHGGGAGGSVNLVTGTIAGNGTISANSTPLPLDGYGGGGGRVAVVLTSSGAGFGDFTGSMTAYSATARAGERGANGTVYRKAQAQTYGDLILNDNAQGSSYQTIISTNVTDWTVGNVIVQSYAKLCVATNAQLAIGGILTNDSTATFTADGLSTVSFVGTTTGTVYGSRSFYNLTIGDPGVKPLYFQAGRTQLVAKALSISNAYLRSTQDGTSWGLKLDTGSGTQPTIQYVNVRNSDASPGATISARDSTNAGGNVNWTFFTPGQTNVWLGTVNSDWQNTNNWSLVRLPSSEDVIRIASGGTTPKLNPSSTLFALLIDSGAELDLNGKDLTVTTNAVISGTLKATASETITFQRDVDFTLGGLTPASSTVVLAGTVPQTVTLDGTETFGTLRVQATNATFNGGFLATRFMCSTPGAALTFKAGSLYTINRLDLIGTVANRLVLRSTDSGTSWRLKVTGYAHAVAVDVARSDANVSGGLTIKPVASVDSLNNENWDFGGSWRVWTGGTSTNFTDTANWNPSGGTIDGSSRLYVQSTNGVYAPVLSGTLTIADLVVGGGGSALLTLNAALTVTNDLRVLTNGVLTHAANSGATEQYKINLTVGGGLYVDGAIDATAKGWAPGAYYGPGASGIGTFGACHGGAARNDGGNGSINNTYGSITNPVSLGSAGYWSGNSQPGGGAVLLRVSGQAVVNGAIRADGKYYTAFGGGSGGSVNLLAGTFSGSGTISANASQGIDGHGGGGGRIAVVLTSSGADFSGFTGSMETYSYAARGSGMERGAPGTIYRKAQAQEYGDLIIRDNGAYYSSFTTYISTNVTDTAVGNVIIMTNGNLVVGSNTHLRIGGSLTNDSTSTFTTETNSTVSFIGTTTGTVYGSRSFYNLSIGGSVTKPLNFEAGKTMAVAKDLSINRAVLRSTSPGSAWFLTLANVGGTQSSITRVDVQDSNATNGQTIVAFRYSVDSGRNLNWQFISPEGAVFIFR